MWRRSQRHKPQFSTFLFASPPENENRRPRSMPSLWTFRKFGKFNRIPPDIRARERQSGPRSGYAELDAFITDFFAELRRLDGDVDGLALLTNDGSPIASFLPPNLEDWIAAEAVWSALKHSRESAATFDRGDPVQVVLSADGGYVIIHIIGDYAAIALTCGPKAKLGMILHGLQETAAVIGPVVKTFMEKPLHTDSDAPPPPPQTEMGGDEKMGDNELGGSGVTVEIFDV